MQALLLPAVLASALAEVPGSALVQAQALLLASLLASALA